MLGFTALSEAAIATLRFDGVSIDVFPTGVTATGAIGAASAIGSATTSVVGLFAVGAIGSVTNTGGAIFSVTGVAGIGAIGSVIVAQTARVNITGVYATGQIGTTHVWGLVPDSQNPNWANITKPIISWSAVNDAENPDWQDIPGTN